MFFIILVGSLFELLGVSAILPFIQALLAPDELMSKPYVQYLMHLFGINGTGSVLTMIGIGIVLIYIVKNVYLAFSSYLQIAYSNNTKRQLAVLMLRSFMNRPYAFFVENGSGVILRGVSDDIAGVHHVMINLFKMASEGLVVVSVAIYLFILDPLLTLGVLGVGLLCMLVIIFGIKKMLTRLSKLYRKAAEQLGKLIMQVNGGIKDIMVFNRRGMFLSAYDKAYENANIAGTRSDFSALMPERVIETGCIAGIIIMLMIRLKMGTDVQDFVPKMAVFAMGAFRLLPSISRLTGYVSMLIYARPMLEATYENYISAREYMNEVDSVISSDMDTDERQFENEITVRGLGWQYPQGKARVLDNMDLTIRKGEAIGIIGESGSGKSTLADLLLRLYKPQEGGIYMDGIDINTIPRAWSRVLAYVPQSVFLMDDTIRANVVFGADKYSDDDVWEALRKASLDGFVRELPEGLDTIVGERGVKFSGGQRQRIAIARALFIKPQILILDEATSALDNETEEAVMEAIDSLAGSMTLIIIAHRVTTLKNCDKIYEIADGRAIERSKDEVIG
ncbi:MAG: ABC transporter ATP-binding protein [Lachnospiraceae bacterium]|nr:ABC transporter ATP-binding protein [Lachnospiraceae bacterium]